MEKTYVENKELYQSILDDIGKKTGGNWNEMTDVEKVAVIKIMKKLKKSIDSYMVQEYYKIKCFASLSVEDVLTDVKELDLDELKDSKYYEQIKQIIEEE